MTARNVLHIHDIDYADTKQIETRTQNADTDNPTIAYKRHPSVLGKDTLVRKHAQDKSFSHIQPRTTRKVSGKKDKKSFERETKGRESWL